MSYNIFDHFYVSQRLVKQKYDFLRLRTYCVFPFYPTDNVTPPVKKWRHSASKRKLLNFEISLLSANWSCFATIWKSTKYNEGFTKQFTFSECLGKNHKTHTLILQFLLVVKCVVEQNKFYWCFIEDANMLYYYRKK